MSFISEGDVYRLITHSKLPGAEKFESWVFDDVLPSLRKDGYYSLAPQENKPDTQNDAILQVLMKNTEVLQAIVQQNQQIMIALARPVCQRCKAHDGDSALYFPSGAEG